MHQILHTLLILMATETYHCHNCTIRVRKNTITAVCKGYTTVPKDLPKNITALKLSNNRISQTKRGMFQRYSHLNYLSLENNQIENIQTGTFEGLDELRALLLNHNKLNQNTSYSEGAFSYIPKLRQLNISNNIENGLIALTYPYLGNLPALSELAMDLVDIPIFHKVGLIKLENLTRLFLNCRSRTMKNTTFLDLKVLVNVTELTIFGCNKVVSVVEADFLRPFSGLNRLIIMNSCFRLRDALKMLKPFVGKSMERIEMVRVNQGFCVGSIRLAEAVMITKDMYQFIQQICLKYLVLADNGIVDFESDSILNYVHAHCFEKITILNNKFSLIRNNKINDLVRLVRNLSNLETFIFSESEKCVDVLPGNKNHIKNSPMPKFNLPPKLKTIVLSSSNAGYIPATLRFNNASNVRYLDLSYYRIKNFPDVTFDVESNLQFIDLSGIPSPLYHNKNNISILKKVQEVRLSNARLYLSINRGNPIFSLIPGVNKLNISYNFLWNIPTGSFKTNQRLRELDMSHNLCSEISVSVMELPKLESLNMQYNVLQTINSTLRDWFDSLSKKGKEPFKLHLVGNVFKCTCDNVDFIQWMFTTQVKFEALNYFKCQLQNGSVQKMVNVYRDFHNTFKDCESGLWLKVGIILLVSFVTVSIPVGLVVNFRWRIAICIYRCFKNAIEKQMKFKYDVYLSCGDDAWEWVKRVVIPKIETSWGMTMYVEERDGKAGHIQSDIIAQSIHESRNILFIVTESFCCREWVTYEIQRAKYEKYCRNLQRIVVLTLDIDYKQFPVELADVIKDVYLIDWIEEESENNWDKLKMTLTSPLL